MFQLVCKFVYSVVIVALFSVVQLPMATAYTVNVTPTKEKGKPPKIELDEQAKKEAAVEKAKKDLAVKKSAKGNAKKNQLDRLRSEQGGLSDSMSQLEKLRAEQGGG